MDDDVVINPTPSSDSPKNSSDTEEEAEGTERVFDITSDLEISPASDAPSSWQGMESTLEAIKGAGVQFLDKNIPPEAPIAAAPTPQTNIKPASSIPQPVATPTPELTDNEVPKEKLLKEIVGNKPRIKVPELPPIPIFTGTSFIGAEFSKRKNIQPTAVSTPVPQQNQAAAVPQPEKTEEPIAQPNLAVDPGRPELGLRQSAPTFINPLQYEPTPPPPKDLANPFANISNTSPLQENPNLRSMRTYEGDVAEVMSQKKISTTQIALAESKRQKDSEQISSRPAFDGARLAKNIAYIVLILAFLGGGAGGAYYLYSKSPLAPTTPATTKTEVTSLIPSDSYALVLTDGLSRTQVLAKIREEVKKDQKTGTIKEIILTKTENEQYARLTSAQTIAIMEADLPDILKRSLNPEWMMGVYADETGAKNVFVVASNNFFQNAFAGMLSWESIMADDIKKFIDPSLTIVTGQFRDRLNSNKDVRQYTTKDGKNLFMYSFVDNSKIVVTSSDLALTEIIKRLEKQAFIR